MNLSEFDYYLPKRLIAQTPIEHRDNSKLILLLSIFLVSILIIFVFIINPQLLCALCV
ncbi:MAG: S-adenosylmethionine:tRNA ribosyltransferase-isomerase [Candidatus Thermoplasmatota archaeon]|nr:S-adenosylmethionine:tRNA ribosyltransferase-isomerase [Candidatus Thermoplasmatota archaeon]